MSELGDHLETLARADDLTPKVFAWCEHIAQRVVAEMAGFDNELVEAAARNGALAAYTSVIQIKPQGITALVRLPDPP